VLKGEYDAKTYKKPQQPLVADCLRILHELKTLTQRTDLSVMKISLQDQSSCHVAYKRGFLYAFLL